MEQSYGNEYTASFDWFMRDYLSVKTGTIPRIDRVYDSFKTYASSSKAPATITEIVQDIYKFSAYYVNMVLHKEPDAELQKGFKNISKLKVMFVTRSCYLYTMIMNWVQLQMMSSSKSLTW
jgi:hypothetical protein